MIACFGRSQAAEMGMAAFSGVTSVDTYINWLAKRPTDRDRHSITMQRMNAAMAPKDAVIRATCLGKLGKRTKQINYGMARINSASVIAKQN